MKTYFPSQILTYALLVIALFLSSSCQKTSTGELKKRFIEPLNGYTQIVEVEHSGVRTLYVSGQISSAETKKEQIKEAFLSVEEKLKKAGASMKDVVKMNTYIVDYETSDLEDFRNIRKELMGNENMPASTLVGVSALALPKWKVEIEAIAIVQN